MLVWCTDCMSLSEEQSLGQAPPTAWYTPATLSDQRPKGERNISSLHSLIHSFFYWAVFLMYTLLLQVDKLSWQTSPCGSCWASVWRGAVACHHRGTPSTPQITHCTEEKGNNMEVRQWKTASINKPISKYKPIYVLEQERPWDNQTDQCSSEHWLNYWTTVNYCTMLWN